MPALNLKSAQRGFILLILVAFAVVAVVGYIVIKRVLESDEAQKVQDTASQVIEGIDQVRSGAEQVESVIDRIAP